MTAVVARLVDKPWAFPLAAMVIAGATIAALNAAFPPAAENRTVIKVCRSGALVLRDQDGSYRVMRPNAWGTWPAIGPEVCQ